MHGPSSSVGVASRPTMFDWLVVGLGFIALSIGFSARANIGLAMAPMEQELGWTRTGVSDAAAWALIIMAVVAPFAGNLVDKFGACLLLGFGLIALGAGMLGTSMVHNSWQFYLAYSLLAAIGFGTVATHVVSTAVSYRFTEGKGSPSASRRRAPRPGSSCSCRLWRSSSLPLVARKLCGSWHRLFGLVAGRVLPAAQGRCFKNGPKDRAAAESANPVGEVGQERHIPIAVLELLHLRLHHHRHYRNAFPALRRDVRVSAARKCDCLWPALRHQSGRHGVCRLADGPHESAAPVGRHLHRACV